MQRIIHWLYKLFGPAEYKRFWKGRRWSKHSNGDYSNGNN